MIKPQLTNEQQSSRVSPYIIYQAVADVISQALQIRDVIVQEDAIEIQGEISWNTGHNLVFYSKNDIVFEKNAKITSKAGGSVFIKSGMQECGNGKVIFQGTGPQIIFENDGYASIYYDPAVNIHAEYKNKYHNPIPYIQYIEPISAARTYMLVHTLKDLESIKLSLHANYALGNNIDASNWFCSYGSFSPISIYGQHIVPFSGHFDGNGFTISDIVIESTKNNVGLFGIVAGHKMAPASVSNLKIEKALVKGRNYVGVLTGDAEYAEFHNIDIVDCKVFGSDVVGGIAGTAKNAEFFEVFVDISSTDITANDYRGAMLGSAQDVTIHNGTEFCNNLIGIDCVGFSQDVHIL